MAKEGFILLHRRITESWIWNDPIKLKWWLDILLTVNHADTKVLVKGKLIECHRGQSVMSLDAWAARWKVSKSTVLRFFELLKKDEKIETQNETVTTRITVCKYDSYNDVRNAGRNGLWNADETEAKRRRYTNKEGIKNDKEIKPNGFIATPEQSLSFEKFQVWMSEHVPEVTKMAKPITLVQYVKLIGQYPDEKSETGFMPGISKKRVTEILYSIENNTQYLKKYRSPYLCILAWQKENK